MAAFILCLLYKRLIWVWPKNYQAKTLILCFKAISQFDFSLQLNDQHWSIELKVKTSLQTFAKFIDRYQWAELFKFTTTAN